ncbi:MAG: zinc-binding dehydrogenase [Oscillospiraceae bacterium]|nr:zinc-binding dehydrogenase [Oscillospiraceae bacterium]
MKTKALRQYGKNDLRLEEFELPPIGEEELLVKVMSDSLCMSSYKSSSQGADHKRVPDDIATNPIIIGHEFCGEILEAGPMLAGKAQYVPGRRFSIQPAMKGTYDAAGYSFKYLGGNTQYAIIPKCYIDQDCVLPYDGKAWYHASMAEPVSCVIGAARASYHTEAGVYEHKMGIREGGKMAALAAAGPMGLALIDYIIHCDRRPSLLVVTDIDQGRLDRAKALLTPEEAAQFGVELKYENTRDCADPVALLRGLANGAKGANATVGANVAVGDGYDDVFVFAPVAPVVEQADAILGYDGCMNFFAGPSDTAFAAKFNFYNVHYNATHVVGTSGGNTDDMKEALSLAAAGRIDPSILITHVGGLDAARDATLRLPEIPGGKKLIYTHISMPLTAIADFAALGENDPVFAELADICGRAGGSGAGQSGGLWCADAERYLLANAKPI